MLAAASCSASPPVSCWTLVPLLVELLCAGAAFQGDCFNQLTSDESASPLRDGPRSPLLEDMAPCSRGCAIRSLVTDRAMLHHLTYEPI